ncbi:helix-turn-helix transcriptional regulator [Rhodococcus erythropolis]
MTNAKPLTLKQLRDRPSITVPEGAAVIGVTAQTAYRMTRDGRLPVVRLGGRAVRVQTAGLLKMLGADQ